ncbi:MAG: hypothetical protein Q9182_006156 [Xanthomendoza sp. 2 TL-2023]
MASPALSQASTAFESDAPQTYDDQKFRRKALLQRAKEAPNSQDILLFLVAFRILNALSIRTFFQPDEYFQSLEPAWEIAFGANSGAWITWEWKNQLRSAIHPALFAGVYRISTELSKLLQLTPEYHAELLLASPKIAQAVFAALGDYYTWKLGERMYRRGSNEAWTATLLEKRRQISMGFAKIGGQIMIVLASSAVVDRLYYQHWTFPPLRFLYFNLAQSLSVHYGRNDWHYYLFQGYPLLLTTFLPFALVGLYQSLFYQGTPPTQSLLTTTIKRQLATSSLMVPFILSFISHKEVRFIYPVLPPLHLLAAQPFLAFFLPSNRTTRKRILLTLLLLANIFLAIFTTALYQQAPLTALSYLRSRATNDPHTATTIAFLTPCHSTPWRSHLIHHSLKAWALSCEPPLHLPPSEHGTYLDEADLFYQSPSHWLSLHLGRPPKNINEQQLRLAALETATGIPWNGELMYVGERGKEREKRKAWTGYLVFFGQLEKELGKVLSGSGYGVCWRGWNGWGHEDWRRRGGMVIWCLDEAEKKKWRERGEESRRQGESGWRTRVWWE